MIINQPSYQDWIFRGYTPLSYGSQNELGQWDYYLPVLEVQNNYFDRMSCVSYSILNCLEILWKFQFNTERNFSDRYIAQLSGTTDRGNSLENVFDTIREVGLVDESLYPDDAKTWDEYYKTVPQEIINIGLDFKGKYNLYREWVNPTRIPDIMKALESAPLQIIVKYDSGEGILNPQGKHNHAVVCYGYEQDKYWKIFDSYTQSTKKYTWNYIFGSILKPTLTIKSMFIPQDNQTYILVQGVEQIFSMGLIGKLMIFDDWSKTLVNSASRANKWLVPKPLTLEQFNSVEHINSKLELIYSPHNAQGAV
jgi:hypothetical protein